MTVGASQLRHTRGRPLWSTPGRFMALLHLTLMSCLASLIGAGTQTVRYMDDWLSAPRWFYALCGTVHRHSFRSIGSRQHTRALPPNRRA